MFKRILHGLVLLALLAGMLAFAPVAPAAARADSKGVSPAGMLNPDGSLKLDGSFSGALDLEGYKVQLDPALGPVLAPIAAPDNWAAVGSDVVGAFNSDPASILVDGANVYVGGWFDDAAGIPEADYIAKWDGSQWTALGSNGSGDGALTGAVRAMLMYGGNLYVTGGFGNTYDTGGTPIPNASYLAMWNGSVWSAVPGVTSPLNGGGGQALAFDSTNHILYVGGRFTDMNGNGVADRLAGIDLDTSSLVTLGSNGAGDGSLNNWVLAIGVDSTGKVYAGGFFTDVNNGGSAIPEADKIAKWDGANWSALGSNGSGDGAMATGSISAIAVDGSDNVYAGGWFENVTGIPEADHIAKWNGSAWSALGSDGAGGGALAGEGGVQSILINGSDIYVGGGFSGSSGIPTADYAARFDTGTNTWYGVGSNGSGNGSLNNEVYALAFAGGKLYAGGEFANVNNGGTVLPKADYFAAWDGSNWSTLGSDYGGPLNYVVNSIAVIGSDVYVGGGFSNFGGDQRMDYLIRWDGSAWNPVGNLTQTWGSVNSTVYALAVDGTDLYAGGYFFNVYNEGVSVPGTSKIAKWNGSTWSALGSGLNSTVFALAVDASHNVYAGGDFTNAASIPEADYVAKWNGSAWSALAGNGAGNGALNSYVSALAVSGSNVYAGGHFSSVVDTSNTAIPNAGYLAKWNGSAWSAMDGMTSPVGGWVFALATSGSDLYVGGNFDNLNGISAADCLAKWNGSTWSAMGGNGSGGSSFNGQVRAIVVNGGNVYVGGWFTNVNNGGTTLYEADYAAKWDGANWSALGSDGGGNGSLNEDVYALQLVENDLWVGGLFTDVNNGGTVIKEADYLAAFGLDATPPVVTSITRASTNPTNASSVNFTVAFSKNVTGVGTSDFTPVQTGVSGATVGGVSGSGSVYTVTVNTGTGNGTLGLNLTDDDSILDLAGNPLGGTGAGNGDFTGEVYTVTKTAPAQITPANGATLNNRRPFFDWSDFAGAKGYQIQVSKSAGFGTILLNVTLTGATNSQYTAAKDLPANTLLYWRVRGKLSAIKYTPWSSVFAFTTGNPPSVPSLVSPANGTLVTSLTPTLDWSDSTVPAGVVFSHYQLQVDDHSDFSSPFMDTNVGVSNTVTLALSPNTKYYWRVRAFGTNGHYSGWSSVRNFREAMLSPTLVSPIGGVTVGSLKPLFDWSDVTGATGYTIQVSLSNTFGSFAINATINTATSQYTHSLNLQVGKLYYWRVRANGPNGPSLWSTVESFVTP